MVTFFKAALIGLCALLASPFSLALQAESCLILPSRDVQLSSPVSGVVLKKVAERGQRVTKGDVLLQLDDRQEFAALAVAKARLDFAERRLERNQTLLSQNILADQEADELETERALAELEYRQARTLAGLKVIRAPVDGTVVAMEVDLGEYVGSDPILRLAQLDPVKASLVFRSEYLGQIRVGQAFDLKVQHSDQLASGVVKLIDDLVDPSSGTFAVEIELPNSDFAIVPGLRCSL